MRPAYYTPSSCSQHFWEALFSYFSSSPAGSTERLNRKSHHNFEALEQASLNPLGTTSKLKTAAALHNRRDDPLDQSLPACRRGFVNKGRFILVTPSAGAADLML